MSSIIESAALNPVGFFVFLHQQRMCRACCACSSRTSGSKWSDALREDGDEIDYHTDAKQPSQARTSTNTE